jgi:hypothetical protein
MTMRTGRFCQMSRRPAASRWGFVMAAMGAPASRPKAKKALMRPARMAITIPLPKEKFCSPDSIIVSGSISFSLERPAAPLTATAMKQMRSPKRVTWPEWVWAMARIWPWYMGGTRVPKTMQRPRAMEYPRAKPRYRMARPKVSPPTPQSAPKRMTRPMLWGLACHASARIAPR